MRWAFSARRVWVSARARLVSSSVQQRVEVGLHLGRERRLQRGEVEQVDVEVAQVAGDRLDALELLAEVLQALGVDRLELALQRARAADGDAQVVQELRVDVLERAGEVVVDHLEQAGEDGRRGAWSRARRGRARGRAWRSCPRRGRPAAATASSTSGTVASGRLSVSRSRASTRSSSLVVAAHRGGRHAPAQALVGLDVEADDGLLVGVEDAERDLARADPGHRDERAHLDHVGQPGVEALGEVVVEQAVLGAGGRGGGRERLAGGAVGQRQPAAGVAQRHPGAVQATVERVIERARPGTDPARRDVGVLLISARASARSAPSGNRWVTTAMRRESGTGAIVSDLFRRRAIMMGGDRDGSRCAEPAGSRSTSSGRCSRTASRTCRRTSSPRTARRWRPCCWPDGRAVGVRVVPDGAGARPAGGRRRRAGGRAGAPSSGTCCASTRT